MVLTTAVASGPVEISTERSRQEVKNGGVGSGGLGNDRPASRSGLRDGVSIEGASAVANSIRTDKSSDLVQDGAEVFERGSPPNLSTNPA